MWSVFDLFQPPCACCGLPTGSGRLVCPGCRADLPADDTGLPAPAGLDAVRCACRYAFPVDRLVQHLKYGGQRPLARPLGDLLACAAGPARRLRPVLLPVPLHPGRERRRGFNQATLLARVVGRQLGLPVQPELAWRRRDTGKQSLLDRAGRSANMQHLFGAAGELPPCIAIVDDVITTGATVSALATVLRANGARRIEAWAVCRTP
jgi:ComF family protein